MSYNRDGLYKLFSAKLLEATILVIKDEVNILRVKAGLSERTDEQILIAISNKLDSLPDYTKTLPGE